MAVYNGEHFLRDSIDSILGQTFRDFEFIIIDDGSTDDSNRIIRSYADPRVRLVENEGNLGLTRSLNRGLRLARGEFIARQDADDISEPERFAMQVAFLDAYPEVALLGTQYRYMDEAGKSWETDPLPSSPLELRWALLFGTAVIHTSVMLRREGVLETVGLYDETVAYAQDYEYWCRIAAHFPVATLDAPLVRYRCHKASITSHDRAGQMPALRASRHARMLGWDETSPDEHRLRSEAISALHAGWADSLDTTAVARAADDILELLAAFTREQGLPAGIARVHAATVRRRLGEHLALLAASRMAKRPREALRLWRRALQIRASAVLRPKVVRKCCGRVATSLGIRVRLPRRQVRAT
jgi:hypothetical protein